MPTNDTPTYAAPHSSPALALVLLGLSGVGAWQLFGVASTLLALLAEFPERLAHCAETGL